jgi:serine/threonine protein kinase
VGDIQNELRAVDKLCTPEIHKNVVAVFRHGKLPPYYYYLDMELCDLNLQAYIERKWTSVTEEKMPYFTRGDLGPRKRMAQIWDIMEDVTSGIAFIHSLQEIHRDMKPRNGTGSRFSVL